jgi:hypothetical protein
MKAFAWIALAMGFGIAIYEGATWYGKSELAPVLIAICIAIGFLGIGMVLHKGTS